MLSLKCRPAITVGNILAVSGEEIYKCGYSEPTCDSTDGHCRCQNWSFKSIKWTFLGKITQISVGNAHSLFLSDQNKVYGMGSNQFCQLGCHVNSLNFTEDLIEISIPTTDRINLIETGIGASGSMVLTDGGDVYSCGELSGRLDGPHDQMALIPRSTFNDRSISSISIGGCVTIFITEDGAVYSCGVHSNSGAKGISGLPEELGHYIQMPTLIACLWDAGVRISSGKAGRLHCIVIEKESGALYGWGGNMNGQLGERPSQHPNLILPQLLSTVNAFVSPHAVQHLSCGWYHSLITLSTGQVLSLGAYNRYGAQGRESLLTTPLSSACGFMEHLDRPIVAAFAAEYHSLLIARNDEASSDAGVPSQIFGTCGLASKGQLGVRSEDITIHAQHECRNRVVFGQLSQVIQENAQWQQDYEIQWQREQEELKLRKSRNPDGKPQRKPDMGKRRRYEDVEDTAEDEQEVQVVSFRNRGHSLRSKTEAKTDEVAGWSFVRKEAKKNIENVGRDDESVEDRDDHREGDENQDSEDGDDNSGEGDEDVDEDVDLVQVDFSRVIDFSSGNGVLNSFRDHLVPTLLAALKLTDQEHLSRGSSNAKLYMLVISNHYSFVELSDFVPALASIQETRSASEYARLQRFFSEELVSLAFVSCTFHVGQSSTATKSGEVVPSAFTTFGQWLRQQCPLCTELRFELCSLFDADSLGTMIASGGDDSTVTHLLDPLWAGLVTSVLASAASTVSPSSVSTLSSAKTATPTNVPTRGGKNKATGIRDLALHGCAAGDQTLVAIADLATNATPSNPFVLRRLTMHSTSCTLEVGYTAVARLLRANRPSFTYLELNEHLHMQQEVATLIAGALRENHYLQRLSLAVTELGHSGVQNEGAKALLGVLEEISSQESVLYDVDVSTDDCLVTLSEEDQDRWTQSLERNLQRFFTREGSNIPSSERRRLHSIARRPVDISAERHAEDYEDLDEDN